MVAEANVPGDLEMGHMNFGAMQNEVELPAGRAAWKGWGIGEIGTRQIQLLHEPRQFHFSGEGIEVTCDQIGFFGFLHQRGQVGQLALAAAFAESQMDNKNDDLFQFQFKDEAFDAFAEEVGFLANDIVVAEEGIGLLAHDGQASQPGPFSVFGAAERPMTQFLSDGIGLALIPCTIGTGINLNESENIGLLLTKKADEGVEIFVGFSEKTAEREWKMEFNARPGRIPHIVKHESHLITLRTLLHPGGISSASVFLQNWLGGKWKQRDKGGVKKRALILAPHPDDESLIGLLPLRLREECGVEVWTVPVTLGSRKERRAARASELRAACNQLEFRLKFPVPPSQGTAQLKDLVGLLKHIRPAVVFLPHAKDGHPTHRAAHRLGVAAMDALAPREYAVVETEYWHPLEHPNLMVAAGGEQLASLCQALLCHKGEVMRNDYAARLPAWMIDNVRRGAELLGGAGSAAPEMTYATLYRVRKRAGGKWHLPFKGGRFVESSEDVGRLLERWG